MTTLQGTPIAAFSVNELQLSPALCVSPDDSLGRAMEEAYVREYSILPVTSSKRELLGYLDVASASSRLKTNPAEAEKPLKEIMRKFQRKRTYTVITPDTGLDELSTFFQENEFAIITDQSRKFVLAVCTRDDLNKFSQRFNPGRTPSPSSVETIK